jgi:virginiamycin B lyase
MDEFRHSCVFISRMRFRLLLLLFLTATPLSTYGKGRVVTVPASNQLNLSDYVCCIATGPDGHVWVIGGKGLGRVEDSGSITYVGDRIQPAVQPLSFLLAPDGAFRATTWSQSMSSILRMTTSGGISKIDIRPAASLGLAAANDGRVWFTEGAKDRVGSVNAGGVIEEIALDPTFDSPGPITIAPDQSVWFSARRKVGHMTASGQIEGVSTSTFFLQRVDTTAFNSIVAQGDGSVLLAVAAEVDRLGFGAPPGGAIVRVTSTGQISTVFERDTRSLSQLTMGPDGSLWFVDSRVVNFIAPSFRVVRLSPDGTARDFDLPPWPLFKGQSVLGYAIDSRGTLWVLGNSTSTPPTLFRFPDAAK